MKRLLVVVSVLALLTQAACSLTVPLQGAADDGSETFSGKTTGYTDGSGVLSLTSSKGRSCTGEFVYVTQREGRGTFRCADGAGGSFTFVSAGKHGTGVGSLGGKRFTFSFG